MQPFVSMVDEYPDGPARERAFAIIETLARTDFDRVAPPGQYDKTPCLRFADDGAQDLFIEWYEHLHREKLENPDEAPLIVEYLSKQPKTMSEKSFRMMLDRCAKLDPDGNKYQASGIGRSDIRRDLLDAIGIQT